MNDQRIALLQKYRAEEPENPFNTYALAMEYYNAKPDEALNLLSSLREMAPHYLPTYFKLAHLYWDTDEMEKAKDTFLAGIQLATQQQDPKALKELQAAYKNFEFEL